MEEGGKQKKDRELTEFGNMLSGEEKERFEAALRRKQLSLILAEKMKPSEASELKRLFA